MAKNDILLRLRLSGQKAVAAGLNQTAGTAEKTGSRVERAHKRIGTSFGGMAKRAIGAGSAMVGAYASIAGAKKAIDTTTTLAKTTLSLHNNLGLSVEAGSRWAAVASARNVEGKALAQTFGILGKNIEGAKAGTGASADEFKKLGITQAALKKMDFDQTLKAVSDGLGALPAGTARNTAAMKLFGRGWQTIVPVLRGGSKAMNEQLALADKYGVTLKGKTVKSLEELIAAQRESKFATMGLQVAVGTLLAPAMTKVIRAGSKFVLQMRTGTGAGGQFAASAKRVWAELKPVAIALRDVGKYLIAHPKLIVALIAAFAGFKILTSVIAAFRAVRAVLIALQIARNLAGAFWLLNAAMSANPAVLIAVAVIAVAAALVLAYKKVGWFRKAVQGVFGWIKKNWPLLLAILTGPIGLAILAIVKNFDKIKGAAKSAINAVISVFNAGIGLINAITPGPIKVAGRTIIPGIPDIPKIPALATGGAIRRGGAAVVGDRGPELLDLPTGGRVFDARTTARMTDGALRRGGAAAGRDLPSLIAALDRQSAATHRHAAAMDRLASRPVIVKVGERELLRAHFGALATETAFS